MYHLANKKHNFFSFRLPDGSLMEITKVYPLDAVFDNLVSAVWIEMEIISAHCYGV